MFVSLSSSLSYAFVCFDMFLDLKPRYFADLEFIFNISSYTNKKSINSCAVGEFGMVSFLVTSLLLYLF